MVAASVCTENGLNRQASKPSLRSCGMMLCSCAVIATNFVRSTGLSVADVADDALRMRRIISLPFISGISMSVNTMCGFFSTAILMASSACMVVVMSNCTPSMRRSISLRS